MAQQISLLGIDIAKLVFHVVDMHDTGHVVVRKRIARRERDPTDQLDQHDKQRLVFYHHGNLCVSNGLATMMMRWRLRDGQALARPFNL